MYLSQRYSLEDFNEVLDKNNPEVFKIKNKTGEGSFKSYNVFPGVFVVYNDFDMYECSSTFKGDSNMFCIDYCKEGRMEWVCHNNVKTRRYANDCKKASWKRFWISTEKIQRYNHSFLFR